jgi:hypothetical protein
MEEVNMNRVEMLKLAYARGAFLALREAGYQEKVAEDLAIKIADRDALDVIGDVGMGAGIGGLGGAALGAGAGALYNPMARAFGGTERNLTTALMPSANNTLRQKMLSGLTGGVPGATEMAGPQNNQALQAILNSPNALRNLIRESQTAGNVNMGARVGGGTGMGAGGLAGGLMGDE